MWLIHTGAFQENRCNWATGIGWLRSQLLYSQRCYSNPVKIAFQSRQSPEITAGQRSNCAICWVASVKVFWHNNNTHSTTPYKSITFGFFLFSPRMPSCSISLLARALSDTNTIGWHMGNRSGCQGERRMIKDRREERQLIYSYSISYNNKNGINSHRQHC